MKDGAIVANSGHFNDEINIPAMERDTSKRRIREFVDEYSCPTATGSTYWRAGW